jgi:hypothetical protein
MIDDESYGECGEAVSVHWPGFRFPEAHINNMYLCLVHHSITNAHFQQASDWQ